MIDFLRQRLTPIADSVTGVLHIGAHTGQEAPLYEELGIKNVVWVEANPAVIPRLRANVEPLGHRVIECAVGGWDERANFHVTSNDGESSSLLQLGEHKDLWPDITVTHTVQVKSRPLNILFPECDLWKCNLWVLDIQGGEYYALANACMALSFADFILTELNFSNMYLCGGSVEEIDRLLSDFTAAGLWESTGQFGECFYVRRRYTAMDLFRKAQRRL